MLQRSLCDAWLSLQTSLRTLKLGGLPSIKSSELYALDKILDTTVPNFRRKASKSSAFAPVPEGGGPANALE